MSRAIMNKRVTAPRSATLQDRDVPESSVEGKSLRAMGQEAYARYRGFAWHSRLLEIDDELNEFAAYGDDWDFDGSPPVSGAAIEEARRIIWDTYALATEMMMMSLLPTVSPSRDGGVSVTWRRGHRGITAQVTADAVRLVEFTSSGVTQVELDESEIVPYIAKRLAEI